MIPCLCVCRERHDEAIPFFEAALAHELSNAKTWFRLGVSFYKLNHIGDAESAYLRAIQVCNVSNRNQPCWSQEGKNTPYIFDEQADCSAVNVGFDSCLYISELNGFDYPP